jgi:hypothetical protein
LGALNPSLLVKGTGKRGRDLPALPVSDQFNGDVLPQLAHDVIPNKALYLPGGVPPTPDEFVDVVVIGGGLAGLTAAYQLRHRDVVVLDHADHLGGNSRGEVWNGTAYSMGGAYFIETCPGTPLDDLVNALKLHDVIRPYEGSDSVALGGKFVSRFWSGSAGPPEEVPAYEAYQKRMLTFLGDDYPDMPTEDGSVCRSAADLDQRSLKEEILSWVDGDFPSLLSSAIQSYCFSSFNAGWQEISAAAGLNFLAAEEYPLWVMPGGLAQASHRLWQGIWAARGPEQLRTQCLVFDVRLHKRGVQVTYMDGSGGVRSIVGRTAVAACPKKFFRLIMDDLPDVQADAFGSLRYRSYIVANILINRPLPDDHYDLFLLRDGTLPMTEGEAMEAPVMTDVLNARWATGGGPGNSVLTCYWPLPFRFAGLHFVFGTWGLDAEQRFRRAAVDGVHEVLPIFDLKPEDVGQIRLTRWGHSMPIPQPGFYNAGTHNILRAPIEDKVFFANQDNWALPAFETSTIEALTFAPMVDEVLG